MKTPIKIVAALAAIMLATGPSVFGDGFRVGGYLPGYAAKQLDFTAIRGIDELFLFSAETGPKGELKTNWLDDMPWEKLHAWAEQHDTRLILCVGGWERSEHFAAMTSGAETRAAFIASVKRFCRDHKLQGVDLDWEFPKNEREEQDYALLLTELRAAFKPEGWGVFVTVSPEQNLKPAAIAAVDAVQLMSYDRGRRHATFESMETHVEKLLEAGVPKERLVVGLPFYGRRMEKLSDAASYHSIIEQFDPQPEADEAGGYYFNGQETIRRKTRYAREKGLRGVMFWQLGQDTTGPRSLLGAIREEVAGRNKAGSPE